MYHWSDIEVLGVNTVCLVCTPYLRAFSLCLRSQVATPTDSGVEFLNVSTYPQVGSDGGRKEGILRVCK